MNSFPYYFSMRVAKEIFIENLKAIRKSKGITQLMLAEMADLSSGLIGEIETGKRNPTLTTIEKIALALDVPVSQLFYDTQEAIPASAFDSKENLTLLIHQLVDKLKDYK